MIFLLINGKIIMTKADIIKLVASECEITQKDSEQVVNKVFELIGRGLKNNDKVNIAGFGIFSVKDRSARKGVNPRTREELIIPARKDPSFKASKTLKDALNN